MITKIKKFISLPGLVLIIFSFFVHPATATEIKAPDQALITLIDQALLKNPNLASLQQQVKALAFQKEAVQVIKDPVVALEYSNFPWDSWKMGDSPMTGLQLKVMQTLPFPGKNQRRQAVAGQTVQTKKLQLEVLRLELAWQVKQAYWFLTLVRQLETITQNHIQVVEKLLKAVRYNYETGKKGQHEILRLEVQRDKLTEELNEFERRERGLTAAINKTLHREITTEIITPENVLAEKSSETLKTLVARALKYNPKLKQFLSSEKEKRLAADQVYYERHPDITVWGGYRARTKAGMDQGMDFLSIGLSLPLPMDYTNRFKAARASKLAKAAAEKKNIRQRWTGSRPG